MGLDEIIKSIDIKVNEELEKIKRQTEEETKKILTEAKEKAGQNKEKLLFRGKKNLEDQMKRKLIQTRIEENKDTLKLKRKLIDEMFEEAFKRFQNLDKREYLSLMKEALLNNLSPEEEDVILISPHDEKMIDKEFIRELERSLPEKKVKLRFLPQLDEKERGFVVRKRNMEINCTLSALFAAMKDKIEIDVARQLFGQ